MFAENGSTYMDIIIYGFNVVKTLTVTNFLEVHSINR